jgi:hypothetical protein
MRQLLAEGKRADAIDLCYDTLDNWLLAGNFEPVREVLREVEREVWPKSVEMSILIVTAPWRGELGVAREDLANKVLTREPVSDFR